MQMRQELLTWAFSTNVRFDCVPFTVSSSIVRGWVIAPPCQDSCSSSTGGRTSNCLLPGWPTTMNSYKYTSKEHITNLKRLQQCLEIHTNVLKACLFSLHGFTLVYITPLGVNILHYQGSACDVKCCACHKPTKKFILSCTFVVWHLQIPNDGNAFQHSTDICEAMLSLALDFMVSHEKVTWPATLQAAATTCVRKSARGMGAYDAEAWRRTFWELRSFKL